MVLTLPNLVYKGKMRQIVLTQVKIVLTLPNLVYKGNETNSVNSGQNSVNSSEPSLQGK